MTSGSDGHALGHCVGNEEVCISLMFWKMVWILRPSLSICPQLTRRQTGKVLHTL